ncbi:MAG: tetratricopeptide repeat protein, partial [Verrucomicrobia bacterium]|nr:tetratricopeptide repeat protein [Verrucomicrobiota bacterium]
RGEKLDEGLKLVHKALAIDPENGAFLDTLGWIYYMQGRYTEALAELQKAKSIVQNDSTVWEHLGDTYLKLNDRDEASKHWKKALELDPESQRLKERLSSTPTERRPAEDFRADTPPHP